MKLEETIVYLLASSSHVMRAELIAREINERKLYERWDKSPVTVIPAIRRLITYLTRSGLDSLYRSVRSRKAMASVFAEIDTFR